jgi:C1A family cysteine protease
LNSCSANAIAAAIWITERRHNRKASSPSRLFIYYNERAKEGEISINGTVELGDGCQSVARTGTCSERMWPYNVRRFRRRPPAECYTAAAQHRPIWYGRIEQALDDLKGCLAEGFPFTGAFAVYESFLTREVKRTGIVPLPVPHDRHIGGHAMLVVGYDDRRQVFIVRNSWGREWGIRGYGYLPYKYVLDPAHAWDFWTVRRVTTSGPAARGLRRR